MASGTTEQSAGAAGPGQPVPNVILLRWMAGQALRYPWRCCCLLFLNLALLSLGLASLTLIGIEFDVLRYGADPAHAARPNWRGWQFPDEWLAAPLRLVVIIAGGIILWAVLRCALQVFTARFQGRLVQHILTYLRASVYEKLQSLSFRFYDAHETGSIINRATGDVATISGFAQWGLVQVVVLVITLGVDLVYMLLIHPKLTLVCLGSTPLLLVASVIFSKVVRPAYDENRRLYDELIMTLTENIRGQHVVKGFARQAEEIAKFRARNARLRDQQRWLFMRTSIYSATVNTLTMLNLVLVLAYGGYLVILSRNDPVPALTVGKLIIFAALLSQFSGQVAGIADIANLLQASLTSAQRVYEVLQAPLDIQNAPHCVAKPRLDGQVEFCGVHFSYRPQDAVLTDISLKVPAGACVAILGATGSGKSTLLSLISRFYDPQQGRILVDGLDLRELDLRCLRRNVGIVFQESFLFSNTVAFNISFGHPTATREQIEHAAQVAAAHDFIMALPHGYDTVIGEHGADLSGGQRQRLAIARAILTEPAILILDDATAAIDPETEREILQAMDNAMQGRTTFIVAHRLSTLRRADLVVVLDRGRIIQRGTHQELIKAPGYYQEMSRLQLSDDESHFVLQALRWDRGEIASPWLEGEGHE